MLHVLPSKQANYYHKSFYSQSRESHDDQSIKLQLQPPPYVKQHQRNELEYFWCRRFEILLLYTSYEQKTKTHLT
ncbi:hypothetical protein pdam_00023052 [Pocillopora damicornis]|uniref:Uncharacterized protein n=1 Tax=Pocillopora damicornis TaxID=46731 RepID=A0A3M6V603_POCDA|nr:hypothetical protein pdam_00023052 [Pocillopora damicornis]